MINEMRKEGYQVTELCAAFEQSKSSYYAARKRPPSKRAKENEVIVSKIKEIHEDRHLKVYGSPTFPCADQASPSQLRASSAPQPSWISHHSQQDPYQPRPL